MKKSLHFSLLAAALAALACLSLSSCNTVRGAGRDVEHVGDAVQRAAS